jgi:uncharacterized UPF0160 family protein
MATVASIVTRRLAKTAVFSSATDAVAAAGSAGKPLVGTHDGSFHCDEAVACGILHYAQAFSTPLVVRTRVPDELEKCHVVVDVGAKYIPETNRLDHHQAEFQGTMTTSREAYKTRLSSAGLVYKHFGREIIREFSRELLTEGLIQQEPTDEHIELVYDVVYKNFVEHVDGIDNGVEQFSAAPENRDARLVKNYNVSTTLSARIAALHTRWNEKGSKDRDNAQFHKAMILGATEFFESVEYTLASWLPARDIVEKAVNASADEFPHGHIVVFRAGYAPWKDHLMDIEKERSIEGRTLYVVFPDDRGGGRVQSVPVADASFKNRKDLPWRGLRDDDLTKASGIDGGVFVHVSGFIGGNKTLDGAVQMAVKAVDAPDTE